MYTSRAEHRLLLGVDTARERLMAKGESLGLVRRNAFHVERDRWRRRNHARRALERARLTPTPETRDDVRRIAGIDMTAPTSWAKILRRQDVDADAVTARLAECAALDEEDRRIVVGLLRYDGYLARQGRERERIRRLRHIPLPEEFDPAALPGVSREVAEALSRDRPRTLADAERVAGMTPAAAALLAGWLASRGGR
jgi:tRNA uridine 5-carboxymethylaminomethyl modification enzyme